MATLVKDLLSSYFPGFCLDETPVDYVPIPPTEEHTTRVNLLGIMEPLLRPSVPPRTTTAPRSLAELPQSYRPPRFHLVRSALGAEPDPPDNYFEMLFVDIFARARQFAKTHFGRGEYIPATEDEKSLWLEGGGFTKEFVTYASLVARQDNFLRGWEALLASDKERPAMVCGIIAKALEDGAWDKLLFGASKEQEESLSKFDAATTDHEGFQRTAVRTRMVNTILGPLDLPVNFWSEVDLLTTRVLTLLCPVLDLLDAHFPASRSAPLAPIHADLHTLVAEAGFLAVCIRRSSSIFRLVLPLPGDMHSTSTHIHDKDLESVYRISRRARGAIIAGKADVEAEDMARERGCSTAPVKHTMSIFRHAHTMAKVKLVIWPGLDRYGRRGSGKTEEMEVAHVRKATVGYYCGGDGLEDDALEERPTLREYIREVEESERGARRWFQGARFSAREILGLTGLLLAVLGLLLFHEYILELLGRLDEHLWGHGDVRPEAPLEEVHVVEESRLDEQMQTWKEKSFVSWFLAWLRRVATLGTGGAT